MALIHSSARSAVILEYSEKSAKTKDAVLTTHTILYLGASKVVLCHWWRAPEHHLQPRELRLHERQVFCSLRKQKTSCDATGGFLAKWRLKDEHSQIPYPWRAIAHIWVVLLIGRSKFPTNQKQWPDLSIGKSSVWNFSARVSDVTSQGNQWWRNVGCNFSGEAS